MGRRGNDKALSLALKRQLSNHGVVFVQLASADNTGLVLPENNIYFLGKYQMFLQNQNSALVLEPWIAGTSEWKRIGIAWIADWFS